MMYNYWLALIFGIYILSYSQISSFISILKSYPPIETAGLWSRSLQTKGVYGNLTLCHRGSLNVATPSYAQILKDGILSVTSFSLLRKGSIMQFDLNDISNHVTLKGDYLWPNELTSFHHSDGNEILLIPDGFLMPGQSNGGLYAIINPNGPKKYHPIRITNHKPGWFYHRAVHVKLPNGRHGIITARAHKPLLGKGRGELVWINMPDSLHDLKCNSNVTQLSTYWEEIVLAEGPDVMFEVLDSIRSDGTIDIVAAHFFNQKLSIHTIRSLEQYPFVEIIKSSTIDTVGRPYGITLASFENENDDHESGNDDSKDRVSSKSKSSHSHLLVSTHECSYDIPSTISMVLSAITGVFPRIRTGSAQRGVRDGESLPIENGRNAQFVNKGGSLFAYKIPNFGEIKSLDTVNHDNNCNSNTQNHHSESSCSVHSKVVTATTATTMIDDHGDYHIKNWSRQTLFRGFKVRGWGGIFSPGAPGFPYVIPTSRNKKPIILLAGDCTGSAYIFTPSIMSESTKSTLSSKIPEYNLAFEVECGATVGSLAVQTNPDDSMDIFIPSYELNKIHVFRLTSSE